MQGRLLTAQLMQMALETDRVQEVDYLLGDDPYKRAWMSQRRERWGIVGFDPRKPPSLVDMLLHVMGRVVERARAAARAMPALNRQ